MRTSHTLIAARAVRAFGDGFTALLLPVYLSGLGFSAFRVGALTTATLLGSAMLTLAVGLAGHRVRAKRLLFAACVLMAATGLAFSQAHAFWPLMVVGFLGTLNPVGRRRQPVPAAGAVAAGPRRAAGRAHQPLRPLQPGRARRWWRWARSASACWRRSRPLTGPFATDADRGRLRALWRAGPGQLPALPAPAGPAAGGRGAAHRRLDRHAGGCSAWRRSSASTASAAASWCSRCSRCGCSTASACRWPAAGAFFFWTGRFSALSQLAAAGLARRIGLINTMVFTHIPASLCVIAAAFAPTLPVAFAPADRPRAAVAAWMCRPAPPTSWRSSRRPSARRRRG